MGETVDRQVHYCSRGHCKELFVSVHSECCQDPLIGSVWPQQTFFPLASNRGKEKARTITLILSFYMVHI